MSNTKENYIIEHHGGGGGGHGGGGGGHGGGGGGHGWGGGGYPGYSWNNGVGYDYPYNYVYVNDTKKCENGYKYDPTNINSDQYGCVKEISESLVIPIKSSKNGNTSKVVNDETDSSTKEKNPNIYMLILFIIIFMILVFGI